VGVGAGVVCGTGVDGGGLEMTGVRVVEAAE
jgi:hypothetical protein